MSPTRSISENPRERGAADYRGLRENLQPLAEEPFFVRINYYQRALQSSLDFVLVDMKSEIHDLERHLQRESHPGKHAWGRLLSRCGKEWCEHAEGFLEAAREAGDNATVDYISPKLEELKSDVKRLEKTASIGLK